MAIQAYDNFTRANASSWGAATSGGTWSFNQAITNSIVSDTGTLTGITTNTRGQLGSTTLTDGVYLAKVKVTATGDQTGVICRYDGASTFYIAQLGAATLYIKKSVSGTSTTLANTGFSYTANQYYWIKLSVISGTQQAKAWQDGTSEPASYMLTASDTAITASGGYGVECLLATTSDTATFGYFEADNTLTTTSAKTYRQHHHAIARLY